MQAGPNGDTTAMVNLKDVLTTGQVAKLCNVAPRTVSKWFDSGQLRGYRIPGSRDRRIPVTHLVSFMKVHGMPLNGLDLNCTRVLVLDVDGDVQQSLGESMGHPDEFAVSYAKTAFEAGVTVESTKPDILVVNIALEDVRPDQICRDLRSHVDLQSLKLIAIGSELSDAQGQQLLQYGFDAYICKPFDGPTLINAIRGIDRNGH
jgi:two-component system, OmpR family, response regulator RpaA